MHHEKQRIVSRRSGRKGAQEAADTAMQKVKVVDQCIPDAAIVEVDLAEFFQFIAKVTAERRKPKDHYLFPTDAT